MAQAPLSAEERIAHYTFWLTWATIVLAVTSMVQGVFLLRADQTGRINANAAKAAADAAIAAQRAWLSIEARVIQPLVFNDDGVETTLAVTLVNEGNAPATHVQVFCMLAAVSIKDGLDLQAGTRKALKIAENWRSFRPQVGFSIFPKKSDVGRYGVMADKAEIQAALDTGEEPEPRVIIHIGGCVDYSYSGGVGQTTFSYTVTQAGSMHMGFLTDPRALPAGALEMRSENVGVRAI